MSDSVEVVRGAVELDRLSGLLAALEVEVREELEPARFVL